jgi:hypothetical protein
MNQTPHPPTRIFLVITPTALDQIYLSVATGLRTLSRSEMQRLMESVLASHMIPISHVGIPSVLFAG